MPVESDKVSVLSTASTLSDSSDTKTLVEHEGISADVTGKEKTESSEKSGSIEPSKPAYAQPTISKTTLEKPARASVSSKGLEPFLYANWGWGGPPCIDFPTAELRREREEWEKAKKSG